MLFHVCVTFMGAFWTLTWLSQLLCGSGCMPPTQKGSPRALVVLLLLEDLTGFFCIINIPISFTIYNLLPIHLLIETCGRTGGSAGQDQTACILLQKMHGSKPQKKG